MKRIIVIIGIIAGCSLLIGSSCKVKGPLSKEDRLEIFNDSVEENLKPNKWDDGSTTVSNENRLDLFKKHIKNVKGGYIGVGTTQNFTLAIWAQSEWIWLIDFTKIAVAANKIHISFLKKAKNVKEFTKLWQKASKKEAMAIIEKEYKDSHNLAFIKDTWEKSLVFVMSRIKSMRYLTKKRNYKSCLTHDDMYQKIRKLALEGRIKALKGDLNGPRTVLGIAENAKKMNLMIRIVYLSNAEEYFKTFTDQFRKNISSLPVDEKSVLVRTATIYKWIYPWAPDSEYRNPVGFHYNTMPVLIFNKWLTDNKRKKIELYDILKTGKVFGTTGYSSISAYPKTNEK